MNYPPRGRSRRLALVTVAGFAPTACGRERMRDSRAGRSGTVETVIRKRVVVSGLVQGVFYRDTCRREALARGVTGWVRNRADGTVEAAFQGEPEAVEAMVAWSRRGPGKAHVSRVLVTDEPPQPLAGFEVKPTG
jgi:acylphosphatase